MNFKVSKYGSILTSRPAGREAALSALAYEPQLKNTTLLYIDFEGVAVMTPSWLSEFVQTLKEKGINKIIFIPSQNPTVISSIQFIEPEIT
jgi:hypothetical protein